MNRERKIEKLAVIGAGQMGRGIIQVSLPVCDTVLIKDVSLDHTASGMNAVYQGLDRLFEKKKISRFQRDALYGKMVPCDDYSFFKNCDLVIETVIEDLEIKKRALRDVEDATGPETIFASNTSALPISRIAEGCRRPQNVVGMHYFSPVPLMPLLEIITTPQTDDWVIETAASFGYLQKKKCIVVRDGPAFYTTRILASMLNQVGFLIEQGINPRLIDKALMEFGFPVGPVTLLDEVGIDTVHHVTNMLESFWNARSIMVSGVFKKMFKKGFHGRKNGKGFYRYDIAKENKGRPLNMEALKPLGHHEVKEIPPSRIADQAAYAMINEAVYCLEEKILESPEDGDTGAVLGLGFPRKRGGPFKYIDGEGVDSVVEKLRELERDCGPAFAPSRLLIESAAADKKFYS